MASRYEMVHSLYIICNRYHKKLTVEKLFEHRNQYVLVNFNNEIIKEKDEVYNTMSQNDFP